MALSHLVRRIALSLATLTSVLAASPAEAADGVGVLIIKEHGVGTAAQAQEYVDKLVGYAAKLNGWTAAAGKYVTTRTAAEGFIHESDPHFGIMSLGAFLSLRGRHNLDVLGAAEVAQAGGRQYYIISAKAADLAGCKGKKLASDAASDVRFVDQVLARGAFKLADFELVPTRRPIQTIKSVIKGEAECALVDDAQFAELGRTEGGAALKAVWTSEKLPPMVVVAFPSAPAAERKTFQGNLAKVCAGEGAAACGEVGIQSLKSAGEKDYKDVITAYGK